MYRKIILLITFCLSTIMLNAQDCPEPTKEKYNKVMSSAFAEDFEKCPVMIEAEYLKEGFIKNMRKPRKIKKMYFFQCTSIGGETKPAGFGNELSGDYFVIDKKLADKIIDLKKGDKIKLTGTTFTQNYFGIGLSTYFKVTDVMKIE